MLFVIRYSAEAFQQLKALRAFDRAAILDRIEAILMTNPALESKATVKRLRQPAPTEYRLRVGDHRIFYNVSNEFVDVVQFLSKQDAIRYLESDDDGSTT